MPAQILILGFHRIGYPPQNATIRGLFTTPRLLAFQLGLLKRLGFRFATLKDALTARSGKVVAITFDDGYADNITLGLPILEKFDAPATVFVITGDVGARDLSWEEAGEKLPADLMTWDDLRTLSGRGWEIGSHAHSHIHLARYSRERQRAEIMRSADEIEENIGLRPVSFAYPYGSFDVRTKEVLADAGFFHAVTIEPVTHRISVEKQDPLELCRVSIGGRNADHYFKTIYRTAKTLGAKVLRPSGGNAFPAITTHSPVTVSQTQ